MGGAVAPGAYWPSGRGGGRLFGAGHAVEQGLQLLAHLEVRDLLGRDVHLLARLRVAALARGAVAEAEAAEAPDLDLLAALERGDDAPEGRLDDDPRLHLGDVEALRHDADQVGLGHRGSRRLGHFARTPFAPPAEGGKDGGF